MTRITSYADRSLSRRSVLAGTAAAGAAALLLPATARAETGKPISGGTLKVATPFNPATLDPLTGRNITDFNVLFALYDALISFDPNTLELKPMLARSWQFTDSTTLVLDLQEGVEFHDGEPFNAEAVVFNLVRCMEDPRSNVKSDVASIERVEATGPHQVSIRLRYPDAALPAILSNRVGCIVSPASIRAAADGNVDRQPVGAGPFKIAEWRDNDLIRVERNTNYWQDGLPYLDTIEFRIVNEHNTAARTVAAGESHVALNLGAQQIAAARRDPNLVAEATPTLTYYSAFFNYGEGPLADVRVRQAMNWSLDREVLNKVLLLGLGQGHCSMFPADFWATDPETLHYYKHDVDRAKSLLTEAGYPNGIEIETWTWPDQAAIQRREVIGAQLAEAGIRLKVTPAPPAQTMQQFLEQRRGHMLLCPIGGSPDPSMGYERQFAATAYRNAAKIELDGFRPLMDESLATFDQDKRSESLHRMQRFVLENALHFPQFSSAGMIVRTPKVHGFFFGLIQAPRFHEVWLEA